MRHWCSFLLVPSLTLYQAEALGLVPVRLNPALMMADLRQATRPGENSTTLLYFQTNFMSTFYLCQVILIFFLFVIFLRST